MTTGILTLDRLSWAAVLVLLLDVAALTSIWRSRKHSRKARVIWTIIVAFLPLFGAVAWFALGRERRFTR
ncbi:MAG TPA: PLD nuclease N-terminal domain-containing protein [Gemmatimonadaceae bacterium]|nr:PLD nuclease N-terminal domain-containing protein [Gemmatimonadaceae bacterium]